MKKIILVVLIALGMLLGIAYGDSIDAMSIKQYILDSGWLGFIVFILIYICFTVFMLPGAVLTVIGGAIFGLWGILINLVAATLGATIAFIISKYIAGDWVREYIVKNSSKTNSKFYKKINNLMAMVNKNGWQIVAILRLIPLVPFNLLNYTLGLTTISLGVFIITSMIFMIPGTIAYTYVGVLGDIALKGDTYQLIRGIILAISIFLGLYLLIRVVKSWRKQVISKLDL